MSVRVANQSVVGDIETVIFALTPSFIPMSATDACSSDLKHSHSYIILRHIYLGAGGNLRQVYIIT